MEASSLPARNGPSQEEAVDLLSEMPKGREGNRWTFTAGDTNSNWDECSGCVSGAACLRNGGSGGGGFHPADFQEKFAQNSRISALGQRWGVLARADIGSAHWSVSLGGWGE